MSLLDTAVRTSPGRDCSVKLSGVPQEAKPAPPPEATLIRLARQAARIKMPAAARAAGISVARWSQIETGYEKRGGLYKPISGTAPTIAHMAHAVGLSPDRLEAAGRADAAEILSEVISQETAAEPASDVDDAVAETWKDLRDWVEMMNAATPAEREAERQRIQSRLNRDRSA